MFHSGIVLLLLSFALLAALINAFGKATLPKNSAFEKSKIAISDYERDLKIAVNRVKFCENNCTDQEWNEAVSQEMNLAQQLKDLKPESEYLRKNQK